MPKSGQIKNQDTGKSYRSLVSPGSALFFGEKKRNNVNTTKQMPENNFNPGAEDLSVCRYPHLHEKAFDTTEMGP